MNNRRNFKQDFLQGHQSLAPFRGENFQNCDWSQIIANRKKIPVNRELLVQELLRQNGNLPGNEKAIANIELLANENTFTLTTGHQLCLMGGPLYTFYKIITVIELAEELKSKLPEYNFVPVFWMATEDHDSEEINHYFSGWNEKRTYEGKFSGAVGRHILADTASVVPPPYSSFFSEGKKYADAFREFIHSLFGRFGLVQIDGDSIEFKKSFRSVLKKELENSPTEKYVSETILAFESEGYEAQAQPRSVNIFYLGDDKRELIQRVPGGYSLKETGRRFSDLEMADESDKFPEHFSPNVLLRPVYQCSLLPELAYSGGWAEMNYWCELKSLFQHFEIFFPVLLPRMSATLLTAEQLISWESLGLETRLLAQPESATISALAAEFWDENQMEALAGKILSQFAELETFIQSIDPTLAKGTAAEKARVENYLEQLPKKIRKSISNKYPAKFRKANQLRNEVQPEGLVQERVLNFSAFPDIQVSKLILCLKENCSPLSYEEKWIVLP